MLFLLTNSLGCVCPDVVVYVTIQDTGNPDPTEPTNTETTPSGDDTGTSGTTASTTPTGWPQDLLFVDKGDAQVVNNVDGILEIAGLTALPNDVTVDSFELGDFDADGDDDLYGRNIEDKTTTVWLNQGGFSDTFDYSVYTNVYLTRQTIVGDYDADGYADLAVYNHESARFSIYRGTKGGIQLGQDVQDSFISDAAETDTWLVGDADADGDDDLFRVTTGGLVVHLVADRVVSSTGAATIEVGAGDVVVYEHDGQWGADVGLWDGVNLTTWLRDEDGWNTQVVKKLGIAGTPIAGVL